MYMYVHACMYLLFPIHVHVYNVMYICPCFLSCARVVFVRVCVCLCLCLCVCVCVCVCVCCQTGSGKTYTMGTGFDMAMVPEQQGVIPRAVRQLFSTMNQLREDAIASGDPPPHFEITAQFLEV